MTPSEKIHALRNRQRRLAGSRLLVWELLAALIVITITGAP